MTDQPLVNDNAVGARAQLTTASGTTYDYYRLERLVELGLVDNLERMPVTVRILLENVLRNVGGEFADEGHLKALAKWQPVAGSTDSDFELPFLPARVVLQDFTGVPCVVDLAAMRDAMGELGGDVTKINPLVPVDLVIDHSVQVDHFGTLNAVAFNVEREYERNKERYELLRWGQSALQNFRVVPPGTGIVHQVNLEYLAPVVATKQDESGLVAFPDTLVGTDSHTTMINALGVLGYGVGGIEAEAVMLGQPLYQLSPEVVGLKFIGGMHPGTTATDLVLSVTELLRKHGVVGRFVEFCGSGLSNLSLADRATISNMAPEYGATAGLFPVDDETLRYLRLTGRDEETVDLVERYSRAQGIFRTDATPDPVFNELLELDLSTVVPSLAGPRRPQDRISLGGVQNVFRRAYETVFSTDAKVRATDDGYDRQAMESFPASDPPSATAGRTDEGTLPGDAADDAVAEQYLSPVATLTHVGDVAIQVDDEKTGLHHGSVVIAAITSCTNTSNPSVMLGAGLLAQKAVERGLDVPPYVKTSLAPGSQVVTRYLEQAGVTPFLEALGFHTVGYGCTTCIGNSGPLPDAVATAVDEHDLVVASVLSGNRNFEGRIHAQVRASFLASPPLVVAYALAGTVDIDLTTEPLGIDPNGEDVFLADIWPTEEEIQIAMSRSINPEMFRSEYGTVFEGDERWQNLPTPDGDLYVWDIGSTYVRKPTFFENLSSIPQPVEDISDARVLAYLGDSVTTDHISPAGSIGKTSPAGEYLINMDVEQRDFNSYGSRRGNHEVMVRGTFANIRLRNLLADGKEGNWTMYFPTGELTSIWEASMRYQEQGTPLVVLAGKEYGTGSSRDWAAKGTLMMGVKAVIAESFERIHRSNLVGMGVMPLQFLPGDSAASLGLLGTEKFSIRDLDANLAPGAIMTVDVTKPDGTMTSFQALARVDSNVDVRYYRNGGILPTVLRRLMQA